MIYVDIGFLFTAAYLSFSHQTSWRWMMLVIGDGDNKLSIHTYTDIPFLHVGVSSCT